MALNKLALIRYKTIDHCLRLRHRKWTLEDLMEKVSDALYEFEGIKNGISKRTIQGDIQLMRSNKLGYNAPIVVLHRKFYTFEDPNYSISNSPISVGDMQKMKEAVEVLKHVSGFSSFDEMSDIVARLEDSIHTKKDNSPSIIQMESNNLLKGLSFISPLHQAIREKTPLLISYQSFKATQQQDLVFSPYLLKEYRNRWFLIGQHKKSEGLMTLALDRINAIEEMGKNSYREYTGVDFERYFSDAIGVTKTQKDRGHRVILQVNAKNAPYVATKPLHASQQILDKKEDGSILIRIDVVLNFELEREILGFGESIKVLSPRNLQTRIKQRLAAATQLYAEESVDKMSNSQHD
ncbi:WYL domain-containing protein [Sphingobacterium thalpophilum]|uniref:WYL domain-containing protein n=1 Tax=Sphingobacterium thalpophilum TaxID=259 RepID=A0ACD5C6C1_9SPHI